MGKHATWKAWLKLELPMCFEMLYESDIWSGDSSASSHSTSSKMDAVNKRQLEVEGNYSTIHASGQFMTWNGTMGLKATLTDVNYNGTLNLNLISLTRLHCNGWSITSGNAASIILTNGSGGVISWCPQLWDADMFVDCTDVGTKMNIQKAHGLLGHDEEESISIRNSSRTWLDTH